MKNESFLLPNGFVDLLASPDSTKLAYKVKSQSKMHLYVSGQQLFSFDHIGAVAFSQDSHSIAIAAFNLSKWVIIFDGVAQAEWDDVGLTSPVISPDGKHVAYTAQVGRDWFAILDGEIVGGPYEGFGGGGIVFSPDSQRILYVIKRLDLWLAIADGKELESFPTITKRSHLFSPDSKKVAFIACTRGSWNVENFDGDISLIIDGEAQQIWNNNKRNGDGLLEEIYFSPNSKRIAYGVYQNHAFFFVINNVPQKKYHGLVSGQTGNAQPSLNKSRNIGISFSPDSIHFAYAVSQNNSHILVYDGVEKVEHQAITNNTIVFSPDSNRLAYGAEKGARQFMVVDWIEMESYDGLPPVEAAFSPDSKNIAYIASKHGFFLLVINSQTYPIIGGPIVGAKIIWDDCSRLHVLTISGQEVSISRFEIN